ncbi:hypothetical protein BaRGS_00016771 [Batillaria attramentaria]|uniref:Uncharacterized protein n=1 Tax=Batillaria attramentaria TaxID=370345 RepID=A0ABD0KXW9_9CAEN
MPAYLRFPNNRRVLGGFGAKPVQFRLMLEKIEFLNYTWNRSLPPASDLRAEAKMMCSAVNYHAINTARALPTEAGAGAETIKVLRYLYYITGPAGVTTGPRGV